MTFVSWATKKLKRKTVLECLIIIKIHYLYSLNGYLSLILQLRFSVDMARMFPVNLVLDMTRQGSPGMYQGSYSGTSPMNSSLIIVTQSGMFFFVPANTILDKLIQ